MKINFYEVGLSRFHGSGLLSFIRRLDETGTSASNSMLLSGVSIFARTTAQMSAAVTTETLLACEEVLGSLGGLETSSEVVKDTYVMNFSL